MKNIFYICIALFLASCSRSKPEYVSAERIFREEYSHQTFNDGNVQWQLREILGAEGPYKRGDVLPIQSNPGQSITYSVLSGSAQTDKLFAANSDADFFLGIPVVNEKGQNAMIILETQQNTHRNSASAVP